MSRGAKFRWYPKDAARALSDPDVLSLDWAAKGILDVVENVLWAITDTPGYFVKRGHVLTKDEVFSLLRIYQGGGRDAHLHKGLEEIIKLGLLQQDEQGAYYSARIVEEHEASKRAQAAGHRSAQTRQGDGHSVEQAVKHGVEQNDGQGASLHTYIHTKQGVSDRGTPLDETEEFCGKPPGVPGD